MEKLTWNELCQIAEVDDGLPVRESGFWAEEKLLYWHRYIDITTTAMVGKPQWAAGVCYVDLFAGPGICKIKTTNARIPGSPLIAAYAPKSFSRILLCEKIGDTISACERRLENSPAKDKYQIFPGDCNQNIGLVTDAIPKGALTVAFLDPTGLHLHFQTVQRLSKHGPVDLLILFPDAVDILRNVEHTYFDQPESNLDKVLGANSNWRERKEQLSTAEGTRVRQLFAEIYREQLQDQAGYRYFADEVIRGPSGPLYRLVYCTKHKQGLDFWYKSLQKDSRGQSRLF